MRVHAIAAAVVLASCASRPAPAPAPPAASTKDEWSTSSWDDRHDTMTWVVLPQMGRLFATFEERTNPVLTCRTCHGPDPERVAYAMPRGLRPLDPAHMPAPSDADQRGRIAKFMIEKVTPKMIELLDTVPFDPTTGRGFGCFSCHPKGGS